MVVLYKMCLIKATDIETLMAVMHWGQGCVLKLNKQECLEFFTKGY